MPATLAAPGFVVLMERVGISLAIGMMIGLEREWSHKDVGTRTFGFVCLSCMLAWTISPTAGYIMLGALIPLATLLNWRSLTRDKSLEMTTTAALFATALLGILVGQGFYLVAAACGVVITILLAWKSEVVRFAGEVTIEEIRGALLLGAIALVVYPLLPRGTVDPWHLINLRAAWIVVLVISAIAFGNYVLLRLYGTRGILWTGLLGGLVNSTATVAELAVRSRIATSDLTDLCLQGMLTANVAMLLRNGIILGVFDTAAISYGWVSVACMLLATAGVMSRTRISERETAPLHLKSPISLAQSLMFGAFFVLITVAGEVANRTLGGTGFLVVAVLGGLVSSASTSAAAAILAAQGSLTPEVAGYGVIITSMASLFFHVPMAEIAGRNRGLTIRLAVSSGIITAAGLLGLAAQALVPHHL